MAATVPTDLFTENRPLAEALEREGAGWAAGRCEAFAAALGGEPLLDEIGLAGEPRLAAEAEAALAEVDERQARRTVERLAVALQASLLVRHAPDEVAGPSRPRASTAAGSRTAPSPRPPTAGPSSTGTGRLRRGSNRGNRMEGDVPLVADRVRPAETFFARRLTKWHPRASKDRDVAERCPER